MGLSQLAEPQFEEIYYDNKGGDFRHHKPTPYNKDQKVVHLKHKPQKFSPNKGKQKFLPGGSYVPYNLRNFNNIKSNMKKHRGGLGANIGTEKWFQKKLKTEK